MYVYSDNEIYQYFTRYHISYSLNGRTSAALHCIKSQKKQFDKAFNVDSKGGICFLLRCIKAELCHGKLMVY